MGKCFDSVAKLFTDGSYNADTGEVTGKNSTPTTTGGNIAFGGGSNIEVTSNTKTEEVKASASYADLSLKKLAQDEKIIVLKKDVPRLTAQKIRKL